MSFTSPTSRGANDPTCIDELLSAYNERASIVYPTALTRADFFSDMQHDASDFQLLVEFLVPLYVNHTANGGDLSELDSIPMWTMSDIWSSLGQTGWRRYADKPAAKGGTLQYGRIQPGDCIDPSFYEDVQNVLKLLKCQTCSASWGDGEMVNGDSGGGQDTWDEAKSVAEAASDVSGVSGYPPYSYSGGWATYDSDADVWSFAAVCPRSWSTLVPEGSPFSTITSALSVDIYFKAFLSGWHNGEEPANSTFSDQGTGIVHSEAGIGKKQATRTVNFSTGFLEVFGSASLPVPSWCGAPDNTASNDLGFLADSVATLVIDVSSVFSY